MLLHKAEWVQGGGTYAEKCESIPLHIYTELQQMYSIVLQVLTIRLQR